MKSRRIFIWIIIPSAILGILYVTIFLGLPNAEEIKNYVPISTAIPAAIDWNKPAEHPIRIWVPLEKISPLLQKAVVISEDDLFYQHNGVNFDLMTEAFKVNWQKKRYVRGASTITMQLARNAFLHKRKTMLRKIREIILARRLEKNLSKKQILELYLNVIEWGANLYGVEAAARYYFQKPAAELDLAEATLLAGIIPNPKYFNPFIRPESCQRMQKRVLLLMQISKQITSEQAQFVLASTNEFQVGSRAEKPARVDSLEEAKYLLSDPTQISLSPPDSNVALPENRAKPDSIIRQDSAAVKTSEDSLHIRHLSKPKSELNN